MTSERIIYCMNACYNVDKLLHNVNIVNNLFGVPPIFIASNGISRPEGLPDNVVFEVWGQNQGWQLGALNSTLQSLKMAAKSIPNIEDYVVIFSHDDIYPVNKEKIMSLVEELDNHNIVFRRYVGTGGNVDNSLEYPYIMLEDMIMTGTLVKKFYDIDIQLELVRDCAELSLGKILWDYGINPKIFDITSNNSLEENDMGFFHDHRR